MILRSSVWSKAPDFSVGQGYHHVESAQAGSLSVLDADKAFLIHIPVQSRTQIAVKLVNGHNRLVRERHLLSRNQGYHWVDAARALSTFSFEDTVLRSLALGYPHAGGDQTSATQPLEFNFPYVKSPYEESQKHLAAQIAALMDRDQQDADAPPASFTVFTSDGVTVLTSRGASELGLPVEASADSRVQRPILQALDGLGSQYSVLIEPLFGLPTRLPMTAWEGHIPFMFVLFKLLQPRLYVELGVHYGASLIAACTAARSYNIRCQLIGIDTWEGDDHAGHYEGEQIYRDLKQHLDSTFSGARLIRSLFAEARPRFAPGSIDILHIDGLHSYDAVREDFATWLGAMAPSGVVLFHDICVFESGFGVHRLWSELKQQFETMEFHHSYGLGVLFLDPGDQRLNGLVSLSKHDSAMTVYRDLVAGIAGTLRERVARLAPGDVLPVPASRDREVAEYRSQLEAVYASTSWRVTAPLRALKRHFG